MTVAVLGAASQILVAAPEPTFAAVIAGCVIVSIACLVMILAVLSDQPYAPGHGWKRWIQALMLAISGLTSWLSFAQLLESGLISDQNTWHTSDVAESLSYCVLVLSMAVVAAIGVAIASAIGQGTAVSFWCHSFGRRAGWVATPSLKRPRETNNVHEGLSANPMFRTTSQLPGNKPVLSDGKAGKEFLANGELARRTEDRVLGKSMPSKARESTR